ncbi:MAG: hypothetical protein R3Y63_06855 [Eubacteriales bacterium]
MEMYPNIDTSQLSLQSRLFGHRMKSNQTKYEYLLEFLLVALSPKSVGKSDNVLDIVDDLFPIDIEIKEKNITYYPEVRMGLKRFIFFQKGKLDGKAEIDRKAYEDGKIALKSSFADGKSYQQDKAVLLLQHLLGGFSATGENRSWFDQCLVPICPEVIFPESMGPLKLRAPEQKNDSAKHPKEVDVDHDFDFTQHTYFCRGGEIYYLHVLHALQEQPQEKTELEGLIRGLLHSYPDFSHLCNHIQKTWEGQRDTDGKAPQKKAPSLTLGGIPDSFASRDAHTLEELKNLLSSNCHPFEQMELLANGLILQMLRMLYNAAATPEDHNFWVIDVDPGKTEHQEMKKFARAAYQKNQHLLVNYLHKGYDIHQNELDPKKEEKSLIKDAESDSVTLFRKLGKEIGLIIPIKGADMRFTLSEGLIKFLVLTLIPPNEMITLDLFLAQLHSHFAMVIGPEEYRKEVGNKMTERSLLENNKKAFAQKMKDCGFLRDLSDATAIVENPYGKKEACL